MIVSPKLQDLPETLTPESSASSSAHEGSGANPSPLSEGSSSENTPSVGENVEEGASSPLLESMEVAVDLPVVAGWENKTISDRLSNLRKAPHTLMAGFRFKANLHHEVADCSTSIKGYKRLEEVVRQYHVPGQFCYELAQKMNGPTACQQQGRYPYMWTTSMPA
ncbi:hypothetical protein SLEP1_g56184 [Rubroshorea leprosula]|uniref:Uncharacterized protein n=1 Tax=Rubroshorea leprosula TaxID=152421 RepID=A0AAV5MK95_9ROSI|nr:hypothetical protein SLEP1_g56184 [Rubroshorea leprosula]